MLCTRGMDALEIIKEQHDDVDRLIGALETCDDDAEAASLFTELANKIAAHSRMEQELFYRSVDDPKTHALLVQSTEEHLSVFRVLADLLGLEPGDERFVAKLAVMKEQLRHHMRDEEEAVLFPQVEKLLSAEQRSQLGDDMLALYDRILIESPGDHVPEETAHAAPI